MNLHSNTAALKLTKYLDIICRIYLCHLPMYIHIICRNIFISFPEICLHHLSHSIYIIEHKHVSDSIRHSYIFAHACANTNAHTDTRTHTDTHTHTHTHTHAYIHTQTTVGVRDSIDAHAKASRLCRRCLREQERAS